MALHSPFQTPFQAALDHVVRAGLQRVLAAAIEAEVGDFLLQHQHLRDSSGRKRIVRSGYLPERSFAIGAGEVSVRVPRIRDRSATNGHQIRFFSRIVPRYRRGTMAPLDAIPSLYLRCVLEADFIPLLHAIAGPDAQPVFSWRFAQRMSLEGSAFAPDLARDLSALERADLWLGAIRDRFDSEGSPDLLLALRRGEGDRFEILSVSEGAREARSSWNELLLGLHARGLRSVGSFLVASGGDATVRTVREIYGETPREGAHRLPNEPKQINGTGPRPETRDASTPPPAH